MHFILNVFFFLLKFRTKLRDDTGAQTEESEML